MPTTREIVAVVAGVALGGLISVAIVRMVSKPEAAPTIVVHEVPSVRSELLKTTEVAEPPSDAGQQPEKQASVCEADVEAGFHRVGFRDAGAAVLYVPESFVERQAERPQRVPVLILFHDDNQDGAQFVKVSGFLPIADKEGLLIVAPLDGDLLAWRDSRAAARVSPLISGLAEDYCVDKSAAFVVGFGAGGRPAEQSQCFAEVAGIATASFRGIDGETMCEPMKVAPMMTLIPTEDGYAPLDGSKGCGGLIDPLSVKEKLAMLTKQNSCSGKTSPYTSFDGSECEMHRCDTPLAVCMVDGGRRWPGTKKRIFDQLHKCDGPVTSMPYASVIWSFFSGGVPPRR